MAFPLIAVLAAAAGILGSGASIFGSIYGAEKQEAIADEANRITQEEAALNRSFNAEQAQINREWQEKMANTTHQREVKDLAAAGLNTWLSAGGGATLGKSSAAASTGFPGAQQANVAGNYAQAGNVLLNGISQLIGQEFIQEALTKDITQAIDDYRYHARHRGEPKEPEYSPEELRALLEALGD